jgi:dihydropteroate synthase
MINEGAIFLDIGGQSTRPGSERVSADEELKRIIGPVAAIAKHFPEVYISIDTYHALVVTETVAAGACLVNDISAGSMDPGLVNAVAAAQVPYVLMHMKGTPEAMQQDPHYDNVTGEVLDFFVNKSHELRKAGITDIIIDPGFGFGKTIRNNFDLLRDLKVFKMLDSPVMLGVSRKSTIYKTLGITVDQALNGTTVLNTIGLMNGAWILRVHDVKEAVEAVCLVRACQIRE